MRSRLLFRVFVLAVTVEDVLEQEGRPGGHGGLHLTARFGQRLLELSFKQRQAGLVQVVDDLCGKESWL